MCVGNGLLSSELVYSERQKRKGKPMFRVSTRYRDGTRDDYECVGEELARAWFKCRVNAGNLEAALGRFTVSYVALFQGDMMIEGDIWEARI